MRRTALAILGSGVLCMGILVAMLLINAWPLWYGTSIYLKAEPVDPRDLMRGQYVTLGYDISNLRVSQDPSAATQPAGEPASPGRAGVYIKPIGDWYTQSQDRASSDSYRQWRQLRGKTLYVQLQKAPSTDSRVPATYRAVSLSDHAIAGAINLQGTVDYAYGDDAAGGRNTAMMLTMNYGIDAWFVQEGEGSKIERQMRRGSDKPVYAEIAVLPSGKARVRRLITE